METKVDQAKAKKPMSDPADFEQVRKEELKHILGLRRAELETSHEESANPFKAELFGLALSGGGIRSATFNLGLIQALAQYKLLRHIDYLSTVSGGGYIGSWLSAWISKAKGRVKEVEEELRSPVEPEQVSLLREFSNYLAPDSGLLTLDTLHIFSIYIRNFLLNLLILVALLSALLLIPRFLGSFEIFSKPGLIVFSTIFLVLAVYLINHATLWQEAMEEKTSAAAAESFFVSKPAVVATAGLFTIMAAGLSLWFLRDPKAFDWYARGLFAGVFLVSVAGLWGLARLFVRHAHKIKKGLFAKQGWYLPGHAIASIALAAGLVLFAYLWSKASGGRPGYVGNALSWHGLVWGAPAVLVIIGLANMVFIGISGRDMSEYARERWSRFGGMMVKQVLLWVMVFGIAVYGPYLVMKIGGWAGGISAAWIFSTGVSVYAAMHRDSGKPGSKSLIDLAAKAGPYVFVVGILLALSYGIHELLVHSYGIHQLPATGQGPHVFGAAAPSWEIYAEMMRRSSDPLYIGLGIIGLSAVAAALSYRVDVNVFSLHAFYRNRLVRCYLGASNHARCRLPFIDFDPRDNIRLDSLADQRPYHLINTTLNLTKSPKLCWQERKAASFVMSPFYCGFQFPEGPVMAHVGENGAHVGAYRLTSKYVNGDDKPAGAKKKNKKPESKGGWLPLGTALTISGAAATPNMGFYSSPAVAFLMTVFDVRLGQWIQNTGIPGKWEKPGPRFGLWYLLRELSGMSDEKADFVYLSDGGHFENLGLYELVRRRCRFIIVSDASMDNRCNFEGLGNAVRKCHVDLGVQIDIDPSAIIPAAEGNPSRFHCAVGTIKYSPTETGYLLYIKTSLTGNEPADVAQYARTRGKFPHESTADQFFSESQFESYRKLGHHIGEDIFEEVRAGKGDLDLQTMFVRLKDAYYPPGPSLSPAFSKHRDQLARLEERQSGDPRLKFLDAQIYPEWIELEHKATGQRKAEYWLPRSEEELRAGFYHCSQMLDLMESVYIDLNLREESGHPDNRGWMNLFNHWAWSGMLRATYAVSCSIHGSRFQTFCERRLNLHPGEVGTKLIGLRERERDLRGVLGDAEKHNQLNFLEVLLIRDLIARGLSFDSIALLQLSVSNPVPTGRAGSEDTFQFTFGFALIRAKELVFMRVQDHLRGMGLGRKALAKLMDGDKIIFIAGGAEKPVVAAFQKLEGEEGWLKLLDVEKFSRLFDQVATRTSLQDKQKI